MCGIAGIVRFDDSLPTDKDIRRMVDLIKHRGPDGEGILVRDQIAIGHRRLSIIDIEGGRQPMSNEDGNVWVTYNGELYNFEKLRDQLRGLGHVFKSNSDTEVIVHAFEQWGSDCVRHFRGMFAFAVVDFNRRKIFLARDHLGIKPLYIRSGPGYIAFASEIRALLASDHERPQIRPEAIEYFLRYRYIPHPDTIYENTVKLPPAHCQTFDFEGRSTGATQYWELEFNADHSRSEDQCLDEFEEVLNESVKAHLVSDVPFGAFLSGGVDSTLVLAEMGRILNAPVKAFTIGFDEEEYSEIKYAQVAAKKLGVDLHYEIVKPDVIAIFDELVDHYGEPFADTSALPTWCVSKLARGHVPMVLSGDGGDEIFAGYPRYELWANRGPAQLGKSWLRQPKRTLQSLCRWVANRSNARLARWQPLIGMPSKRWRSELWQPGFRHLVNNPCPGFVQAARHGSRFDRLSQGQCFDLMTYLPGDILTKVDVASMCHGLEVRTPLTDIRVLEFAAHLPASQRRGKEDNGKAVLKVLPKKSLARDFSAEFVHRPKMGFAIPEVSWLAQGTPIRQRFDDMLGSRSSTVFDYLDVNAVTRQLHEFDSTNRHSTLLWPILILATWLEQDRYATGLRDAA